MSNFTYSDNHSDSYRVYRNDELQHGIRESISKYIGGFIRIGNRLNNSKEYNHDYYMKNKSKWKISFGKKKNPEPPKPTIDGMNDEQLDEYIGDREALLRKLANDTNAEAASDRDYHEYSQKYRTSGNYQVTRAIDKFNRHWTQNGPDNYRTLNLQSKRMYAKDVDDMIDAMQKAKSAASGRNNRGR